MTDALLTFVTTGWTLDPAGFAGLAAVFIIGGLLPIPRTPMILASGLAFGLVAIPVIILASTAGGIAGFIIARYFLQQSLRRRLTRYRYCDAVLRAVDIEGWTLVALLRFYGPIPTTVQNYAFGLTTIGFRSFTIATLVFSMPQIAFYCYLGALGQHVLKQGNWGSLSYATAATAVVCCGTAMFLVGRRTRAILDNDDGIVTEAG